VSKTVLIVDDDPAILRAVETFLKIKGLKVISCMDPGDAFKLAETKHPDLIISDVAMPGIDGFTLLRGLKDNKNTQKIPLILLTATDRITDVEKGFASGAQAYILKPVDWDRAWAKIQPLIA
jgi:CheY-like chemotaxis protein